MVNLVMNFFLAGFLAGCIIGGFFVFLACRSRYKGLQDDDKKD